jgi:sRNA-binding carbon storage regulator CsrA
MLVMTREALPADQRRARREESVIVLVLADGSEVRVWLCEARDGTARIGVDAPEAVQIERGEVYRRLRRKDPTTLLAAGGDRDWEQWAARQRGGPS